MILTAFISRYFASFSNLMETPELKFYESSLLRKRFSNQKLNLIIIVQTIYFVDTNSDRLYYNTRSKIQIT